MTAKSDIETAYQRGWALTPLNGKIPVRPGWQKEPPVPLADLRKHDGNVGLRTGQISGVVVVDFDNADDLPDWVPLTPTVRTGNGWHCYFNATCPVKNRAKATYRGVKFDVRGDGGQVVYPGSIHPDTGLVYEWTFSPDDTPMADFPAGWLASATTRPATPTRTEKYHSVALNNACGRIATATEGSRNDTLNREAFGIAQLVAGGGIDESTARDALTNAAMAAGLRESEIRATLASAFAGGRQHPKTPATQPATNQPSTIPNAAPAAKPQILAPGTHAMGNGEQVLVGTDDFTDSALNALPEGAFYRRATLVGQLDGEPGAMRWTESTPDGARIVIDRAIQIMQHRQGRDDSHEVHYRPCNRDLAGVALAGALRHPRVRDLAVCTRYPVFDQDWNIVQPGWNARSGIYYDQPECFRGIEPEEDPEIIDRTLRDILCDFPFDCAASRDNFFSLLLTPLIAPALNWGNRPLFLITAPQPGSGKSKLAEEVLGGILLGRGTPAMQWTKIAEEQEKRIAAALLQDDFILHLDNLADHLDSATLASLLTAQTYKSRLLGRSQMLELPNRATFVVTGNNVTYSTEIARRCVPIVLRPKEARPELRQGFRYTDLAQHVADNRRELMACLLGMVSRARVRDGIRQDAFRMGSFERWSSVMGGILKQSNFSRDFLGNFEAFRAGADTEQADIDTLLGVWWTAHADTMLRPSEIAKLMDDAEIFGARRARWSNDRQAGNGVVCIIRNLLDVPQAGFVVRRFKSHGQSARYFLERKS
jgi:hypothetical protein